MSLKGIRPTVLGFLGLMVTFAVFPKAPNITHHLSKSAEIELTLAYDLYFEICLEEGYSYCDAADGTYAIIGGCSESVVYPRCLNLLNELIEDNNAK